MKGRKPLPTRLKELAGNPGKRPLNRREPKPKTQIPPCPATLSAQARSEWKRITAQLQPLDLVSHLDRAALAAYCNAWARWVEAENELKKSGTVVKSPSGFPIQNPYLAVSNAAVEQMRKFLVEFGLTPASRSRLTGGTATPTAPGADLKKFCTEREFPPLKLAQ